MEKTIKTGLLIGIPLMAVLFFLVDPDDYSFPHCIFYTLTGFYCPGCGSQRAIHDLLHLNIPGVISNNILFLPAVLIILYHYLHYRLNHRFQWNLPNVLYMKHTPGIILSIVLLFWIIRNIPTYPFSVLAPG